MTRIVRLLLPLAAAALVVGAFQLGRRLGRPDFDRLEPTSSSASPSAAPTASPSARPTASPRPTGRPATVPLPETPPATSPQA